MARPFRFAIQTGPLHDAELLRARAQEIEALGYDEFYSFDHIGRRGNAAVDPFVPLLIAAEATTTLRVGPLVLNNELHHPALHTIGRLRCPHRKFVLAAAVVRPGTPRSLVAGLPLADSGHSQGGRGRQHHTMSHSDGSCVAWCDERRVPRIHRATTRRCGKRGSRKGAVRDGSATGPDREAGHLLLW